MGILIAIEGIDGAGKTTQARLLGEALAYANQDFVLAKEPTDGPWGQRIRESAQNGRMPVDEEVEAFVEDRKEHIQHTIRPSLEQGRVVVLDRYFYSTIAYQSVRGADRDQLATRMKSFAPIPDIVFLLDADPVVAISRITNGRAETPNEFERVGQLTAVRKVFQWLAESDSRIHAIDGHRPIADIHRHILETLLDGVFKQYRAKPYDCDCWYCSFRETDTCRWLTLREALHNADRERV